MSNETDWIIYQKLTALLQQALEDDKALRKRFRIGDEYDFIPKQISSIIAEVEQKRLQLENSMQARTLKERKQEVDEALVYVYLYNDYGQKIKNWENMLLSETIRQFGVNRPIYLKQSHLERLIQTRESRENHAYLVAIVKNKDIYEQEDKTFGVDPLGQPLVRLREGSLLLDNIVEFRHCHKIYKVMPLGKLREKTG